VKAKTWKYIDVYYSLCPIQIRMGTSGNKDVENKDNAQKQNVSQWAELLTQLVDKITGKDVLSLIDLTTCRLTFQRQPVLMAKNLEAPGGT